MHACVTMEVGSKWHETHRRCLCIANSDSALTSSTVMRGVDTYMYHMTTHSPKDTSHKPMAFIALLPTLHAITSSQPLPWPPRVVATYLHSWEPQLIGWWTLMHFSDKSNSCQTANMQELRDPVHDARGHAILASRMNKVCIVRSTRTCTLYMYMYFQHAV